MRISLIACLLVAMASPAAAVETCRGVPMPPNSAQMEPTVPYEIWWLSREDLNRYCPAKAAACTHDVPTPQQPDRAVIYIINTLNAVDRKCVPIYEKAHLPPNNWIDPEVEARFATR
jgi:hypothetical protein